MWFVVIDGQEQKQLDGLDEIEFSEDGRLVGYGEELGVEQTWAEAEIVEGERPISPEVPNSADPVRYHLSPISSPSTGGHRRSYEIRRDGGKEYVIMNGQREHPRFDEIVRATLVCSPDRKRVAYVGKIRGGGRQIRSR